MRGIGSAGRIAGAALIVLAGVAGIRAPALGEPYIAVASGQKCVTCHVNPTGGGLRTEFGTAYAYGELARRVVTPGDGATQWNGRLGERLSIGGDLRAGLEYVDTPGEDEQSEFGVERGTVYAAFRAVPDLVTLYVDQQVAPGGSSNREAFALLTPAGGKYTVKAGQFFLPYGLRLQDDSAFVRQVTGINFDTPDRGVEAGLELGPWSAQLALTNGTAGGPEVDSGKQLSFSGSHVRPMWRVGASYNLNDADLGDRRMSSFFAGLRTGPIAWLGEVDFIVDEMPGPNRDRYVSLLEGNWLFADGHNLKIGYEFFDPDENVDENERERYSVVWEHTPMQLLQSRIGVRVYNGVPDDAPANRDEVFAELHVYF